jgi:hypothetical protein
MLTQIKTFKGNALAFELTDTFTEADEQLLVQLFEEKLNGGFKHVNLLLKVKDLSVMKHPDFKALLVGEIWGFKHFEKMGRCAVVAESNLIKDAVKIESKALHLVNSAFEEKYFETAQLDEALRFISPE